MLPSPWLVLCLVPLVIVAKIMRVAEEVRRFIPESR